MDFDPAELDTLSREDLILRARARGVERPEQMTRVELRDEIVRRSEPDLERQRRSRGWLGVARDLLASVVESGLNLPDAAAAIRGDGKGEHDFQGPPPVATVTLAEIYAAQGHYEQALRMLDEVIEREPEHATARTLRERIAEERDLGPGRRRKVVETKAETIVTPQPPQVAVSPPPVAPAPEPVAAAAAPAAPPVEPEPVAAPPVPEPVADVAPAVPAAFEPPAAAADVETPVASAEPEPEPEPAAPQAPALVVLQTADRAFVYWRLPALSPALLLRSVTVRPEHQGPTVEEHDYRLSLATGGFWLSRMAPGSEVRAAVGELSPDGFTPLVVARVLDGGDSPAFEPLGVDIDAELETAARNAAGL
ncbi:MAG: tetratricopeptide repeat protein [Myxococcales bacterium]